MKYGIQFRGFMQFSDHDWEYYTGEKYAVNQELYAVFSRKQSDAKPYSSFKRAETAGLSMYGKYANFADMRVVPLDEINN